MNDHHERKRRPRGWSVERWQQYKDDLATTMTVLRAKFPRRFALPDDASPEQVLIASMRDALDSFEEETGS